VNEEIYFSGIQRENGWKIGKHKVALVPFYGPNHSLPRDSIKKGSMASSAGCDACGEKGPDRSRKTKVKPASVKEEVSLVPV
jgi:hypothetical protein